MKKQAGTVILAVGISLGMMGSVTRVSLAQSQEGKMESQEKMSGDKMQGKEKMSNKKMKKQKKAKKDKMDKMDKMGDKSKME